MRKINLVEHLTSITSKLYCNKYKSVGNKNKCIIDYTFFGQEQLWLFAIRVVIVGNDLLLQLVIEFSNCVSNKAQHKDWEIPSQ